MKNKIIEWFLESLIMTSATIIFATIFAYVGRQPEDVLIILMGVSTVVFSVSFITLVWRECTDANQ